MAVHTFGRYMHHDIRDILVAMHSSITDIYYDISELLLVGLGVTFVIRVSKIF
jgi:hypothetical protein